MKAWNVYLNRKRIDTVFANKALDKESIKSSLINHDGYDKNIVVTRRL